MFEYRQVLTRMRLGDTDRAIARAGLMGRRKAAQLRLTAEAAGWLDVAKALPGDGELAVHLDWAHQVRVIGNEAAHEVDAPDTKEDARDAFEFTEAILIYVFSLAKRFEALRERRAAAGARTGGNA